MENAMQDVYDPKTHEWELLHERLRPLLEESRLDVAESLCRDYLDLAEGTGDRCARMWPLDMLSFVLARTGRLDVARTLAEEAMELALEVHDRDSMKMAPWLSSLCDVARRQEDWESAVEYGEWRWNIVSTLGDEAIHSIIHAETYLGEVLLKTGDDLRAESHLLQAQRLVASADFASPGDVERIERCLRVIWGDSAAAVADESS